MKKGILFCFLILVILATSCNGTTDTGTITSEVDDEATVTITDTTNDTPNTPSTEPDETDVPDTEPDPDTPATTWFFPQLKEPSDAYMEALLTGELELSDGFLKVDGFIIIWQSEYTTDNTSGTLEVFDSEGTVVGRVGELIQMGGGTGTPNNALLKERLPAGTAGPFWIQGEGTQIYVEPEPETTTVIPPDQSAAETTENQSSNALDFVQTDNVTLIEQSTVKVNIPGQQLFGIVVGDGSYVLTAQNYAMTSAGTGPITVTTPAGDTLNATVEAIDPRTQATLLHVNGMSLPPCSVRDSSEVQLHQYLYIQGWRTDGAFNYTPVMTTSFTNWHLIELHFTGFVEGLPDDYRHVATMGAPVTDRNGNVVGLLTSQPLLYIVTLGNPSWMGPCVMINSAMELLEPGAANQSFSQGPIAISKMSANNDYVIGGFKYVLGSVSNYDTLTAICYNLMLNLGEQLDSEPDKDTFLAPTIIFDPPIDDESICLIMAFTQNKVLRTTFGEFVGEAKWIGIHWNRSDGKPDRLFFGTELYVVQGIYTLEGNTSGLNALVQ